MKGTSLLLHCWLAISFHFIAGWLFHCRLATSFHFIAYFISLPISLQAAYFITGWLFHFISLPISLLVGYFIARAYFIYFHVM